MNALIRNGRVILPDRVEEDCCVRVRGNRFVEIGRALCPNADERVIDASGHYVAPGFIDLHMHIGYLGLSAAEELKLCARQLPMSGTTRFLPTLISALEGTLPDYFAAIRAFMASGTPGTRPLGVHLEGPYIAMEARGGFLPEQITTPEKFSIKGILDAGGDLIKTITLAPELPGSLDVIRECVRRGIVVGLGHTMGDEAIYESARAAGATHCTHTYNNRRTFPESPLGGRAFNLDDLAVVDDAVTCELICDGAHVKPVWVKTIFRTKGTHRLCLITDSFLAGRRSAEGEVFQTRGGQPLTVHNGVGRDAKGALSGSVLTQDRALANFIALTGATLPEAVRCLSLNPARVLKADDRFGSIAEGKVADLVLLDSGMQPVATFVGGELVFEGRFSAREQAVPATR